jgi:ribosomal protein L11 methyltransferase
VDRAPDPALRVVVSVAVRDPVDADLVADLLFGLGASAVSESDGGTALVADVPPDAVGGIGRTHRVVDVGEGHASGWQEHATAVRAGRRIVVRPRWVGTDDAGAGPDDVVVVVDAAEAFGSGSHPTTRLCLAEVEVLVRPGERVLDIGSGSGVLGVAALLLGSGPVVAVDVDPVAVDATRRTAELNGVAPDLVASTAAVADVAGRFDLVLANLLIPVIEDLGAELADHVAPGGHLLLSGLLTDQVDRAVEAVGLGVVRVRSDGDWAAVLCRTADR